MALAGPTLLTADPDTANTDTYATPSVSPTAGALIVVGVLNTDGSNAIQPTLSSAFSVVGGSWGSPEATAQNSTGVERVSLFSAVATGTPGSGAITASFGGDAQTGCIIIAVEYTGQDGTDPVLQPQANGHSGAGVTSTTVTLAGALGAATNQMLAFIGHNTNEDQTAGGGGTEVASSDVGYNTPTERFAAYFEVGGNSLSASWSTSSRANSVACEIVEAAAGGTEHFGAASLDLTASVAAAAKKDAKAATATPLTAGVVTAAVKNAVGASATALTVGITVAGTKDAKGASATPLTVGVGSSAAKTAVGSTAVPIVFQFDTDGEVPGGEVEGAASVEVTFGASVAGVKTAKGAAAVPLAVTVGTSGHRDAHGAVSLPLTVAVSTVTQARAYGTLTLPLLFDFTTRGAIPSPAPNMAPVLTGWIAGPTVGSHGGGVQGRIDQPVTGGVE